jgi:hypothetical protein
MKDLTYADRTVLLGDDAADLIIQRSALLAETGHADSVTLNAIDHDGTVVSASFVLGSGTNVMAQSSNSPLPEPENHVGIEYMRERIRSIAEPSQASPQSEPPSSDNDFDFLPDNV